MSDGVRYSGLLATTDAGGDDDCRVGLGMTLQLV